MTSQGRKGGRLFLYEDIFICIGPKASFLTVVVLINLPYTVQNGVKGCPKKGIQAPIPTYKRIFDLSPIRLRNMTLTKNDKIHYLTICADINDLSSICTSELLYGTRIQSGPCSIQGFRFGFQPCIVIQLSTSSIMKISRVHTSVNYNQVDGAW